MSFNQSKSDNRRSGRSASFNQQRGSSGGSYVNKSGTGAAAPSPSLSSSRSFNKKSNNHAQGGPSRVNPTPANSAEFNYASAVRTTPNGSHVQPQFHGGSDAPVTNATAKPSESSAAQRSTRVVPKAPPTSQPPPVSSDSAAPTTPPKGDASVAFPVQFGSISPGIMNGMAIPARTSSAPPNLDEQKRDQVRHDSSRPVPSVPTPPVPKQLPVNKDTGVTGQSKAGETHTGTRPKKDTQVLPAASLMQKPAVIPLPGISMAMPYRQSPAPLHFSAANPQIHSQGMSTAPLQMPLPMPMPLPIRNAGQVQQQIFVPSIQPHPIHHQGQHIGYSPQIGHQFPHQLGNMGINPQYSPQQGGKFAVPRKTTPVKITHPDTHEELRLDKRDDNGGSSGARSHSGMPSQSPSVQPFAASHPVGHYASNSLFYPTPNSLPLSSSQITPNTHPPRLGYAVNHGPQNGGFTNSSSSNNSLPVDKIVTSISGNVQPLNTEISCDVLNAISSTMSGASSVSIKPSGRSGVVNSTYANSSISGAQKGGSPSSSITSSDVGSSVPQKGPEICSGISSEQSTAASSEKLTSASLLSSSSALSEDSALVVTNNEGRKKESLSRSNSLKDNQKKLQKKGQLQHQVTVQSSDVANEPSLAVSETVGAKTIHSAAIAGEDILAAASGTLSATSENMPSAEVKEKTSSSTQVSTCASAVGPVTQAVDSLNKHKSAEVDDLAQENKLLSHNILERGDKSEISTLQRCKNASDGGTEFNQLKQGVTELSSEDVTIRTGQHGQGESASYGTECDQMTNNLGMSTSTALDSKAVSLNRNDSVVSNEAISTTSGSSDQQSSDLIETTSEHCKDSSEDAGSGSLSLPEASGTKDKPILEPSKVKATSKGKKKRKEVLLKADAAGSTSDLYNAYKGPDDKKEAVVSSENTENVTTSGDSKQFSVDAVQPDAVATEQGGKSKAELEDWEDAADMSTPKLEVSDKTQQVSDGSAVTDKKYSRDFLLKFAEQCTDLPEGFEIMADIAEALMSSNIGSHVIGRDSHPSTGRNADRSGGMSRMDRRGSGVIEDDKWSKVSGAFHSDMRLDGIGGNTGFRPGQGGNFGVLRNPRTPTAMQYGGGILSGPMQSMVNQGGMQRNSPDGERWQRAASFQQRGLIPSPLPTIHKAEKKYEVGKVTDEEQAKQRQLKAILNKLTPQNFEKLFEQVKAVNIDNVITLTGVISQIFEKALMEPTFCEMYATFCFHLAAALPDLSQDNEKITFKRLLLNKCQEEFERGEREQEEANKADEGEVKQSDEEREAKRTKARRRMLGNIRLIGELYKKKMLTERIMHECIKKLLGQFQDPDEEDIEALCKLMSTIGEMIDHPKAKEHMDVYFERMKSLSNNMNLSSRVRFMLKDAIDLRKNKWQQRRKVEGPKKIEEVHRDASQERQAQAGRLSRGPGINTARRMPMDFGPRGSSMLTSPNAQIGGLRGLPTQVRGYGSQDVRGGERQSYEARTLSIPLPQRPLGDDSITLGPQGGLARGMSIRGPSAVSSSIGLNGYSNLPERPSYSSREDPTPRYVQDRFVGSTTYDQSIIEEHNMNYGNKDMRNVDRIIDRPVVNPPLVHAQGTVGSQSTSSEKGWSEERLQNMSMAAIKEYYSARDVNEVVLCIKDLNSPSFHPSMVSLWVTDSFERKDTERDLLAKLLIDLAKPHGGTLSQAQLIEGFESVLTTLEDVVTDAPKAPEFLGRIFAKVITEDVVSLKEIGRLIHDGGEEPGSLLQIGLAADVLGSTLEVIQTDNGDAILNEIQTSSNLQLQTFRPPQPIKSRKLEKFI
ncbi:eukaryotic translation initiation factor 4G-like [Cicer arietinum]|uniref:Eukaryotic translation initiation factor 4G n=1 Tax=Cicer arietinum TaxID=3827 RepID=A0A1S2XNV5_CICAR|nr:eukaryotic translation initiation factor 4G-like [Cicer arietinum]XP_004492238.1 eukaryotic translation initiation factor 4G-like [Cicer arietinum]